MVSMRVGFHENDGTTKMTKTTQAVTNKELSAGLVEITETMEMTKTMGLRLRWAKSPIASVQRARSTLASHSAASRGTNVKRVNANRTVRIATQRTQGL